ncbi:MAG: Hsp20/alpha crystallin family protein [archaeon]|nr:Hsp20/alpha crystallin family protein [archaeon]
MPKDKEKEKKKKKDNKWKKKKDIERDEDNPASSPFWDMSEEQEEEFNEQFQEEFQKILKQFGKMFGANLNIENMNIDPKMIMDMLKKMNFDPTKIPPNMMNIDSEKLKEMMKQNPGRIGGPFMFGFNVKMGPDGKPQMGSFGNLSKNKTGETKVKHVREPLTDVIEEEDCLLVVAEMPGIEKKKIDLTANEDSLEIIGYDENNTRKYEIVVPLNIKIEPGYAKASYKNGILEVKLNKKYN